MSGDMPQSSFPCFFEFPCFFPCFFERFPHSFPGIRSDLIFLAFNQNSKRKKIRAA